MEKRHHGRGQPASSFTWTPGPGASHPSQATAKSPRKQSQDHIRNSGMTQNGYHLPVQPATLQQPLYSYVYPNANLLPTASSQAFAPVYSPSYNVYHNQQFATQQTMVNFLPATVQSTQVTYPIPNSFAAQPVIHAVAQPYFQWIDASFVPFNGASVEIVARRTEPLSDPTALSPPLRLQHSFVNHSVSVPNLPTGAANQRVLVSTANVPVSKQQDQKAAGKAKNKPIFDPYITVDQKLEGVKSGKYLIGTLVVSNKSPDQAYVRIPGQENDDINICGYKKRNRALNGDIVVTELLDRQQWKIRPECLADLQEKLGITSFGRACTKEEILKLIENAQTDGTSVADNTKLPRKAKKAKVSPSKDVQKQGRLWMELALDHVGIDNIPDSWLLKTGRIVAIEEEKGARQVIARVKTARTTGVYLMDVLDPRLTNISIASAGFPLACRQIYDKNEKALFLVELVSWEYYELHPRGRVIKAMEEVDEVKIQTTSIIMEHCVSEAKFPEKDLEAYVKSLPVDISEEELQYRQDFRKQCVFTIDPPDAKDLDDAVSCVPLGNDIFEVGVHIADVSFFISENSPVDLFARDRATTVYLVNKVVHMIPEKLINSFCSLDPYKDRRTFSAIYTITSEGEVLNLKLTRGVMRSCAKLSYVQAQSIIDNADGLWIGPEMEDQLLKQVKATILNLNIITQGLRKKRFARGSLRIDQPEYRFVIGDHGLPTEMHLQTHWESCELIEELALLTNMVVAEKIYQRFPEIALLRRHPEPSPRLMNEMANICKAGGLSMDVSTASMVQQSLDTASSQHADLLSILSHLCAKPMKLAEYFCTGGQEDSTWHYALGVEYYTHFTSPIRRYPDIIVHRLLSATLEYSQPTTLTETQMHAIAKNCNEKKLSARKCQEASWNLFMGLYVRTFGPLEEDAVVVGVIGAQLAVDVLITRLALSKRVYPRQQPGVKSVNHTLQENERHILEVDWSVGDDKAKQTLSLWSRIRAVLSLNNDNPRDLKITLKSPLETFKPAQK